MQKFSKIPASCTQIQGGIHPSCAKMTPHTNLIDEIYDINRFEDKHLMVISEMYKNHLPNTELTYVQNTRKDKDSRNVP